VKAGARLVGRGRSDSSRLAEELPSDRAAQRELLHLLMSLIIVGLVTVILFWLDQATAVDLVPIAYLIPVIIAATRWGIWPATLASIASMAACFLPSAATSGSLGAPVATVSTAPMISPAPRCRISILAW